MRLRCKRQGRLLVPEMKWVGGTVRWEPLTVCSGIAVASIQCAWIWIRQTSDHTGTVPSSWTLVPPPTSIQSHGA
jgi:hypothetical protein